MLSMFLFVDNIIFDMPSPKRNNFLPPSVRVNQIIILSTYKQTMLTSYAVDRVTGNFVLPAFAFKGQDLGCFECSGDVTFKKGSTKRKHFAHKRSVESCSGGGESAEHFAAKLVVCKYIMSIDFEKSCSMGNHCVSRRYDNCIVKSKVSMDDGTRLDVGVYRGKLLVGIIEVFHTHTTSGPSLTSREDRVGLDVVWEIRACEILDAQADLDGPNGTATLRDKRDGILSDYTLACKLGNDFKKTTAKRPCLGCGLWACNYFKMRRGYSSYMYDNACCKCHQVPMWRPRCQETRAMLHMLGREGTHISSMRRV